MHEKGVVALAGEAEDGMAIGAGQETAGKGAFGRASVPEPAVHEAFHFHLEGRSVTGRSREEEFQAAELFPEQDRQGHLVVKSRYIGMEEKEGRRLLPFRNPDAPVPFRQDTAHGGDGQFFLRNRKDDKRIGMHDFRPGVSCPCHAHDHGMHGQIREFQGKLAGAGRPVLPDAARGEEEDRKEERNRLSHRLYRLKT
jgi:hypothetical protein